MQLLSVKYALQDLNYTRVYCTIRESELRVGILAFNFDDCFLVLYISTTKLGRCNVATIYRFTYGLARRARLRRQRARQGKRRARKSDSCKRREDDQYAWVISTRWRHGCCTILEPLTVRSIKADVAAVWKRKSTRRTRGGWLQHGNLYSGHRW